MTGIKTLISGPEPTSRLNFLNAMTDRLIGAFSPVALVGRIDKSAQEGRGTVSDDGPLKLPTDRQRVAYNLRLKQGLSDKRIGQILGITAENANRLIRECERRVNRLRLAAARSDQCLLASLLGDLN
ncbi:MAG: hypothetical protein JWO31_1583 [Phycisphaerales bacterium]|nr:hypothetical protein [Phycisphaerales bacterium]